MISNLLFKKRWKKSEQLYKQYGVYELYDIGAMWVDTADIIGLSLRPKDIKDDEDMRYLKKSVKERGWENTHRMTLHLVRLPNGKFTVGSGGNHRTYLSREIGFERLKALVSVLIPTKYLMDEDYAKIEYFTLKFHEYNDFAATKNAFLNSKGVFRLYYPLEEAEFDRLCNLADKMLDKRAEVIRNVAIRNGIMKDNDAELKVQD
ncbi:hypothetical protein [Virgibacillus halodenitrificans]|uniref:hypothetical protein n=1 Tax=Virgibacillus halodenitrificans TaxID=1482 RepID=UPI0007612CDB